MDEQGTLAEPLPVDEQGTLAEPLSVEEPSKKPARKLVDSRDFVKVKFLTLTSSFNGRVREEIRKVVNINLNRLTTQIQKLLKQRRKFKRTAVKLSLDILKRALALVFANTPDFRDTLLASISAPLVAEKQMQVLPIERVKQIAGCDQRTNLNALAAAAIQTVTVVLIRDIIDTVSSGQKANEHKKVHSIMPYMRTDPESKNHLNGVHAGNETCSVTRMQWNAMKYSTKSS